jgi:hypothetical protein
MAAPWGWAAYPFGFGKSAPSSLQCREIRAGITQNQFGLVGAVGIELKAVLKPRKLFDLTKREKRQTPRISPSRVHARYTEHTKILPCLIAAR